MQYDSKSVSALLRETTIIRLIKAGAPIEDIIDVTRKLYIADDEDWDEEFVKNEVYQYQELHLQGGGSSKRSIQTEVEDWLHSHTSNKLRDNNVTISLHDCYLDLNYKNPRDRATCRMAIKRLVERGKLENIKNRSGMYRYINGQMEEIDFLSADTTPFDIKFPLGVHEFVETYQKSLIVIAGEPNAGKTSYCLNIGWKNKENHKIKFFSSEGGAAELKIRLKKFPHDLRDWQKIQFISKTSDFKDVIDPNGFNIIDYLEVSKDFYEIGGILTGLYDALTKGIVIVAIQKPAGRDTGIGGARTLDKARLYLAIEPGILKIVKAKLWRQECVNPNGMFIKWTLGGGANFKIIPDNDGSEWRKP